MSANKINKGIIRWNAIISFLIVASLTYIYFAIFFDSHVKNFIEWAGYNALGSEVNVGKFKTSFIHGNVQINKLEVTNSEKPEFNSIELSEIRFDLNIDALLKAKFVVEDITVDGIQFMSKRSKAGKVAPPTPSSPEQESFAEQLQGKAISKVDKVIKDNVLGDVAQFLKSGSSDNQIKNLESQIISKKLLEDMNIKWASKQKEWDRKLNTLPTSEELKSLTDRFNKIKMRDFSSLDELNNSVKEADSLVKEINNKNSQIQDLKSQFETDLKEIDQDYKNVDQQTKKDIESLKAHFNIPKIDAANLTKSLFMGYLTPYLRKLDTYKLMAQKYLPPKYSKIIEGKKDNSKVDESIQPHPRSDGTTYEFPVTKGYPLFWIQNISISSKSTQEADYGDIKGIIKNITSNQLQIGQPTTAKIDGSFNKQQIYDIHFDALFNNIPEESVIKFDFSLGSYPIQELELMQSDSGSIALAKTISQFKTVGEIIGLKKINISLKNTFSDVSFTTSSNDKTVEDILKSTLGSISKFDLDGSIKGELKKPEIELRSSLSGALEKSFQNLLQSKINAANEQLKKSVNGELEKARSQVDAQVSALKTQAESEIKKIQSQIDDQKKQTEIKIAQAKKDFEDQTKKKLLKDGQKQIDDLKKKFGL